MHNVRLSGSYYDMGFIYGRKLNREKFQPSKKTAKERTMGVECREHVEQVFPEIIDEIKGVSEGSGIEYDELSNHILVYPFRSKAPGCTSFTINHNGETWVGRNYDMFYWLKDDLECYLSVPKGGYRSLAQTDMMVGREDGINEKGLYAALHGVPSIFTPGVHFWISIRYILDKCENVDEAIEYLEETKHHCAFHVMLADRSGKRAVVEVHPNKVRVRWPEGDYIVTTNHLNHPEMKELTLFEPPDSWPRYKKVTEELDKIHDVDEKSFQSILRSHDGLVCSHLEQFGVGTLYSTVTNLNKLKVWRAVGHPCSNKYVEDIRLMIKT